MKAMHVLSFPIACFVIALPLSQTVAAEGASDGQALAKPSLSILDVMEKVITPATNTLWGVDDPKTDEDWLVLEEAAFTTLAAADLTALGGSGRQDMEWVQAPAYQAFNQSMQSSTMAILEAIRARDVDSVFDRGDALYTACEGCHLQFNPSVINDQ